MSLYIDLLEKRILDVNFVNDVDVRDLISVFECIYGIVIENFKFALKDEHTHT